MAVFNKKCVHVLVGVFIWGHCARVACAFVCNIVKYVCVAEKLADLSSVCQICECCSGVNVSSESQVGP